VATLLPLSVPVPSAVAPSRKVTVPVGVALPDAGDTVAVKVMLVPLTALVDEALSAVEVATAMTGFTVTLTAGDVLALKLVSPGYTAVKLCVPVVRPLVVYVATPEALTAPVPNTVAPS
jgi:hypothetical protein